MRKDWTTVIITGNDQEACLASAHNIRCVITYVIT